ncbi:Sec-independent protein translocase subunit TatA [Herbiconiux sp. CPCC 203407]|uniref:Sec-independent protein translocase protein TatA n=1 Tax=Herbiconiux oxytropis TaxID=2970915 RepID=A0AA41XFS7_9MICO|nr:Sec-independent protein translocase subunit TatA [Herbiconiux oxytropis]MCS5721866.1 Sec-independent protein translocase subunit TatA [Herbiconiux oxytropis]MCS5727392.1 Sec-independent protein translocase subunit TatA [Herbiconiux oxytropis]
MFANLNGWHLVIVLVVILLLFGATRLPALSKSLGQSMRIFRNETKAMKEESAAEKAAETGVVTNTAEGQAPGTTPAPGSTSDTSKS